MNFTTILFIAFGLSMDAFAVSITNGMVLRDVRAKDCIKVGIFFGLAQAIMPFLGWLAGINFRSYIEKLDHWIALILLGFIGGNMIYESIKSRREGKTYEKCDDCRLDNRTLFLLAIATSIDALAIGVSFAILNVEIIVPMVVIGITTFTLCSIGVVIGDKCGPTLKNYAEIIGGVILILIGLNIFIEHTMG